MIRNGIIIGAVLLAVGCASEPKTQFAANPEASFESYRTFSWIADEPRLSEQPDYSPKNDDRIEDAIIASLEAKGYQFIADRSEADFVVGYSVGIRKNLNMEAAPDYFGANWSHASSYIPAGGERLPGRPLGAPDSFWEGIYRDNGASVEKGAPEGRLVVDIFDVKTRTPAWQGSIEKKISQHDRENSTEAFNAAISKMFEPFPPRADR